MPVADADAALVERLRGGDEAALEELMQRYEAKVYRLAVGMMKNREDALEAVQDAFWNVYRKIDTFKAEASFSTWLYRIALNSIYMRLRSRGRHEGRLESLEDLPDPIDPRTGHFAGTVEDWSERADDAVLRKELAEVLEESVAELPEEYRAIFTLRDVDGLSNQEVADILGLTLAATKTRLHRARLFLRDRLGRYLEGSVR